MGGKQSRSALAAVLSIFGRPRKEKGLPGEHLAAIAFALNRYSEELRVKTPVVNRPARETSAWGSKIHGFRQTPDKKRRNERL